jgi:hypothetical protein
MMRDRFFCDCLRSMSAYVLGRRSPCWRHRRGAPSPLSLSRASDSPGENLSFGFCRSRHQRRHRRLPLGGDALEVWYSARQGQACFAGQQLRRLGGCAVLGPVWMSERRLRSSRVMSVAPSCLGKSVVGSRVVGGLGAGVLRLDCFGSRQCARSRDRCGCRSGGSGTLLL